MTASTRFICLAAGGTGGHVFPALAVAEQLQAQGHQTLLFTDRRGVRLASTTAFARIAAASPFQRGLLRRLGALVLLSAGAVSTFFRLLQKRPAVMIGFGGYPSFAPLLVASLLRVPTMVHEQNAYLGRANKFLAKRAGHLAISWQATKNLPTGTRCVTSGMPVRRSFFEIDTLDYNDKETINITILGGSLGAGVFADQLPRAINALPETIKSRLRVTQQCRAEQLSALQSTYEAMGVTANLASFFDNVPQLMAESHLVIGRAGASTVAELAAAGRPAILVPLPGAMDDHQSANAKQLEAVGGGICLPESMLVGDRLSTEMARLLGDGKTLHQMGLNARKLATPDAAACIADYAMALAAGDASQMGAAI